MCKPAPKSYTKNPTIYDKKVLVSTVLEDEKKKEHSILIAEGINTRGELYCVWAPTKKDGRSLYLIDQITRKDHQYQYQRKFQSRDRSCILNKFKEIIES